MAEQYVSIKQIGDRLLRNPLTMGIAFEAIIDYTIDFMEIVGVPSMFIEKPYETKIENFRAKLPCDFVEDIQVLVNDKAARYATDTFHNHYHCFTKDSKCACDGERGINKPWDYTFTIQGFFIFLSEKTGNLKMNYRAILTDEEGYPMLPSNRKFLNALEWFIKWKYYTLLWENGRLEDKRLQYAEQQYSWAVGQCETDMNMLSLSKAESFFNSFRTLIPRTTEFQKRFIHNGTQEYLKNH